jgi:hypothetical protein
MDVDGSKRVWMALVAGAVIVGGAFEWRRMTLHPTDSEIEVCRFVVARQFEDGVAQWRARTAGEEEPPAEDKSDAWTACAPLYAAEPCREAFRHANEADPASRIGGIVRACRDAYCPLLDPKPDLCAREATQAIKPSELAPLWQKFDEAILEHDLGARAAPIREARRRGAAELAAALADYFDAGSPAYGGASGLEVRALPRGIEAVGDGGR